MVTSTNSTPIAGSRRPRLPRPGLPSFPEVSVDELRDALRDRQRRIARGWQTDPGLAAWQTVTAPLWLGSGIPVPDWPKPPRSAHVVAYPADDALATTEQGRWLASQMHSLTRRFWMAWIAAATLRGIALGTIACVIWTLGAIGGVMPQPRVLPFVVLVVLGGLVGLAFGLVNRPSLARVASMLDRTFDLRERMVTAFSPPDASPRIRAIQLADAANAFVEIQHDVRGAAVLPMREMVIAALAGIALVTALLFNIASSGIAPTQPVTIPVFVPSSERFAREAQEQKAQALADAAKKEPVAAAPESQSGSADTGAVGDLRAVGTALGTNETTSPAATQIAEGDYAGAEDSLHQSAESAANLPQEERDALADQLDQAAEGMADGPLKDATEKAADGMRQGGDAAEQGMNDLADQIGKTGQQATTQGQASSTGSESKEGSSSQRSSSSASSANGGQQGQSGQDQQAESGQSGSSSEAGGAKGDPGEGQAASSGIGSDPGQEGAGQQGSEGAGGSSQSGSAQAGQEGQPGASSSGANGSGGSSQQTGSSDGQTGSNAQSGAGGSQKSGADAGSQANGAAGGSSQGDGAKSGGADSTKDGSGNTAQDGKASSDVKPGDPGSTSGNSDSPQASSGGETIVLQGTSEESGVATGNETGASSSGSGSGVGAAAGSGKQGTVGPAGPDSNRVPEKYRDLVKAYFDGDGLPAEDDGQ